MATISQTMVREESRGTTLHWIGGQWLNSDEQRESINPATGEVIGSYAYGGRKEAELAMNAALLAFHQTEWKDDRSSRARVLNSMAATFEARSEMGPLINKPNVERVNRMVEDAIAAGAKIIVRGGAATDGPLAKGVFYRPTLLEVTDSKLPIVQQEVFGPVLTMQVFDTEEEAVSLANDSE
jgi:acyl-CoA reductase-like NAD-dependent aldehyde dehydrogenase